MRTQNLIGKTVESMVFTTDKQTLQLNFTDKTAVGLQTEGDCCSYSWIEHIQGVKQLLGQPITKIEEIKMPDLGSPNQNDMEYISYYGLRIESPVGAMIIDYRNSSNGYYGGSIEQQEATYSSQGNLTEDV